MVKTDIKGRFSHPGNEANVISCVLKDPNNFFEVDSKITEEDFLTSNHKALWTIIKDLMRSEITILDPALILNQATHLKMESEVNYEYVLALFEKDIEPSNIDVYIDRVSESSTRFRVIKAVEAIEDHTVSGVDERGSAIRSDDVLEFAQNKFLEISIKKDRGTDAADMAEGIEDFIESLKSNPRSICGAETGFKRLDAAINGIEPGRLIVVGARPKTGKTTLLVSWAKRFAYQLGLPVLYIDTEMSLKQQRTRLLSMLSAVPEREIVNGTFAQNPIHEMAVNEAVKVMKSGLLLHRYYPDFSPDGLANLVRKYKYQYGIGCFVFDYIKLPEKDIKILGNVKEHQALGYLCVCLKNIAGSLDIPVITAAQIGRAGANKGQITSSDFADSDRLLRYADVLLGLSSKTKKEMDELEEKYGKDKARASGTHRLQILDSRVGGTNFQGIDIYFRKEILRMEEAEVQLSALSDDSEDSYDDPSNNFPSPAEPLEMSIG